MLLWIINSQKDSNTNKIRKVEGHQCREQTQKQTKREPKKPMTRAKAAEKKKNKQDGDFKHQVMSSKPHCILETSFMKSGKTTKVRRENFSVK